MTWSCISICTCVSGHLCVGFAATWGGEEEWEQIKGDKLLIVKPEQCPDCLPVFRAKN